MIKIFIFMGVLIATFMAFASPPKFVYRYDSRPPAEIFKWGFSATSPGNGINDPLVHSFGHDYLDNTRFISTTRNPDSLIHLFSNLMITHGQPQYYLYRIRATSNFYGMNDYLSNLRQIGFINGDPRVPVATHLLELQRYQNEWFAVDRIEANQIAGVQMVLRGEGEDISIGPEELNANYVDHPTTASAHPYPIVEGPVPNELSFMLNREGPTPIEHLMGPPPPPGSQRRGWLMSIFPCAPSGFFGRWASYSDPICTPDVTMSIGYFYGLIEIKHDVP
ncbi:hypothetical protein ACW5WN_21005 [Aeromonas lacus]